MKKQTILVTTALSLLLCSCGGGGGGGDSSNNSLKPVNTPTASETATQAANATPSTSSSEAAATNTTPIVEEPKKPKVTGYYVEMGSIPQYNYSNDNFTSLEIWSKKFPLSDPLAKEAEGGWQYTNYSVKDGKDQGNIISTFLDYAKIGNVGDKQSNYAFAIGYETPKDNIPTAGKYIYEGQHIITVQNDEEHKQDASKPIQLYTLYGGDAIFEADFNEKSLIGSFDIVDSTYPFEAKISENTFQTGFFDNLAVQGKFYGPNAEELAGTYQVGGVSDRSIIGAFGAKQVKEEQVQATQP